MPHKRDGLDEITPLTPASPGSNPDLSRNDRWERGDSMNLVSNLPQTGSLERHRILSEYLRTHLSGSTPAIGPGGLGSMKVLLT